jgi:hypothetical protein
MAERRISCPHCCAYDRNERRCRVGKTNPPRKHDAQTVAELFGVRSLCIHNPYREPLIERMYASQWRWKKPSASIRLVQPIEVEIMED